MDNSQIREKVERRVEKEKNRRPPEKSNDDEQPSIKELWEYFQANEYGDSMLYSRLNRGKFARNSVSGQILQFVGPHWDLDRDLQSLAAVEDSVVAQYARLLDEVEKEISAADTGELKRLGKKRDRVYGKIKKLRSFVGRKNVVAMAWSNKDPLSVMPDQLDQYPLLLPVLNGVIDMRTGELRPGRPEDWLTKVAPVHWKGLDKPAAAFEGFLLSSLNGNAEKLDYLHRLCGYSTTGLSKEPVFGVFYGRHGQNGKSTLVEIIYDVLGEMAGPVQSEMLLSNNMPRNSSGPSPDIMALKGKRIVCASETEENARFAVAKVKGLTSPDSKVGRNPNDREQTTFKPSHTLFLITNSKPHAPSYDSAFFTRIKIIDFPLSFVDKPEEPYQRRRDPDLKEKLQNEKSGIIAWLVRGYLMYAERGLTAPAAVINDTLEYRADEDVLANFVDECCKADAELSETFSSLYLRYKTWWEDVSGGRRPLTKKKFGIILGDKYERVKRGGAIVYFGLQLKFNKDD